MIMVDSRKYIGAAFGLSVSVPPPQDPDWPGYYGDPGAVINRFVFDEASNFLFEGGSLVLGHRWQGTGERWDESGVLAHLMRRSREFRSFRPAMADPTTGKVPPAIVNLLAWPDLPPPESEEEPWRLIQEGILEIRQVRPEGVDPAYLDRADSRDAARALLETPAGEYLRIRSLTAMRRQLADLADFRICLGGDFGKASRRLPGVIEEALLACRGGTKPLYISGAFGGAAKALADCLLQRELKPGVEEMFFTPEPIVELMSGLSAEYPAVDEFEGPSTRDGWNALEWFQGVSLDKLAERSGLSTDQYINLLATPNIERAMAWVAGGVEKVLRPGSKS